ncbi:hypothetical protein CLV44_116118 [Marinobacterium halophilum]|uniref:Uncharacterized protein n=1 Tax=Marinobacterium halophilum TaxID=267374 RepID=A0A2P8ETF5_9GAMM|nr:hypothetical protein [Marinobacterium halophilum]PSL12759.1 hypothetical protein CLV44_116118 [Marinobacterium halophilum]
MKTMLHQIGAWVIMAPTLIIFCYVLRPLLALVLIPGGLLLLVVITRGEAWSAIVEGLWARPAPSNDGAKCSNTHP